MGVCECRGVVVIRVLGIWDLGGPVESRCVKVCTGCVGVCRVLCGDVGGARGPGVIGV